MLLLRTSNFQGATIRLSLLYTSKFSSARQFKNHIELFSTVLDEIRESQMQNLKKENRQKPP